MGGMFQPLLLVALSVVACVYAGVALTGVNLSGAEFGSGDIPGAIFYQYTWDGPKDAEYFVGKGMNVYRIPFLWERMQTVAGGPLEPLQLQYLHTLVDYLTNNSRYSLLDPHNFGSGFGGKVGQSATSICLFADLWYKLALEFKDNPYVIFGIMNEPNNQNVTIWRNAAQVAIDAIRYTGATNLITVPGVDWTGAYDWGVENAPVMITIEDPINNFVFEVHQYLDIDSSGTHDTCVNSTIGSIRLEYFTAWARANGKRGLLGEFGGGKDEICGEALNNMLGYMDNNSDVWAGWTYWSGGPWWGDWYFSNLTPNSTGIDRPQMHYVQPHIATSTPTPGTFPAPTGSYTPPSQFLSYYPVYEDKLLAPFQDWSWAKHNLTYTENTFNNSQYSISVDLSTYGALWFKCAACVDNTKLFALEFWFNPGSNGSINHIGVYLMNGTSKEGSAVGLEISAYASNTSLPNTWVKVSVPLGWFAHTTHDGIQISGNVNGAVGEMYFDEITFVAYPDTYSDFGDFGLSEPKMSLPSTPIKITNNV